MINEKALKALSDLSYSKIYGDNPVASSGVAKQIDRKELNKFTRAFALLWHAMFITGVSRENNKDYKMTPGTSRGLRNFMHRELKQRETSEPHNFIGLRHEPEPVANEPRNIGCTFVTSFLHRVIIRLKEHKVSVTHIRYSNA